MALFEYHRPTSADEVVALLAAHGSDGKILAGGQSLVPVMAMRLAGPTHVIDISRVTGLDRMNVVGDVVEVGALVRQSTAESSPLVHEHTPLVAKALPWIGHRAIRNRGTLCGSLAHADPAAELPAAALALDATLVAQSVRGVRLIPASEFFRGYLTTALADDELLAAVRFPMTPARSGTAVVELARRHGDFAVAGAAITISVDPAGSIAHASLAYFGVANTPVRITPAEQALIGQRPTNAAFAAAASIVSASLDPPTDDHGSAAYRRHVAGVLTKRGLASAATDAGITMEAAA